MPSLPYRNPDGTRRVIPMPEELPKQAVWASFCPGRTPKFKPHSDIGKVKSAISTRTRYPKGVEGGSCLQFIDGEWVVRWVVPEGATKDDNHFLATPGKELMKEPVEDLKHAVWEATCTEFIDERPV